MITITYLLVDGNQKKSPRATRSGRATRDVRRQEIKRKQQEECNFTTDTFRIKQYLGKRNTTTALMNNIFYKWDYTLMFF